MDDVGRHDRAVGNRPCPVDQTRRERIGRGREIGIAARAERHVAALITQLRAGDLNARQCVRAEVGLRNAQAQARDALNADLVNGQYIDQGLDAKDAGRARLLADIEQGPSANLDLGGQRIAGGADVGVRCQRSDGNGTGRPRTQIVLVRIAPLVGNVLRIDEQCARLHLVVLSNEHLGCTGDIGKNQRTATGERTDRQIQRSGVKVLFSRSPDVHGLRPQRAAVAHARLRPAVDGQRGVGSSDARELSPAGS